MSQRTGCKNECKKGIQSVTQNVHLVLMMGGGKFLKKLWCCIRKYNKIIWFYQLG